MTTNEYYERTFAQCFGRQAETSADAPGRVNLIGEHTDYNGGYVLPVATPQRTRVALSKKPGRTATIASSNHPDGKPTSFELGAEKANHSWIDYVAGVTHALGKRGCELGGFEALVSSDVPIGSGLSSSAALEIAMARALKKAFALELDDVELATIGHQAETEFVGVPVGTMDQMAASLADAKTALFLDARSGEYERIPLPSSFELLVIDSGISHDLSTGQYRVRREECERAAELLGVACLRDVDADTEARIADLPAPLDRRARHVVTGCRRVLQAVVALKANDSAALGALFDASHASMRDDFEVSVPAVDALVGITKSSGAIGARLTGGGFGGAIVALVEPGRASSIGSAVTSSFTRLGYGRATVIVGGAS
jgi:galactokinase